MQGSHETGFRIYLVPHSLLQEDNLYNVFLLPRKRSKKGESTLPTIHKEDGVGLVFKEMIELGFS
jgi:hypothetical protein